MGDRTLSASLLVTFACSTDIPPSEPSPDPFASSGNTPVLSLDVELRDVTPDTWFDTALPEEVRQRLAALRPAKLTTQRWHLAGARAAIESGKQQVILGEGALGVVRGGNAFRVAPRRMVDLFEGAAARRRRYAAKEGEVAADGQRLDREVEKRQVILKHQFWLGRETSETEAILTVWCAEPKPDEAALIGRAIELVGLPFLDDEGRDALRSSSVSRGLPLRWRLEMRNDRLLVGSRAPVLEGRVTAVTVGSMAKTHFALAGQAWAESGGLAGEATRVIGSEVAGGFRPVVADEVPGPLTLENRTSWHLFVLADGVALARVAPQSKLVVELPAGYYRIYARSLYGTFHSGPRDLYVPGVVTFEY